MILEFCLGMFLVCFFVVFGMLVGCFWVDFLIFLG